MALVRVRLKNGIETNVSESFAKSHSDDLTVLDEPTNLVFGRTPAPTRKGGRPILPATSVDTEASKKKAVTKPAATKGSDQ